MVSVLNNTKTTTRIHYDAPEKNKSWMKEVSKYLVLFLIVSGFVLLPSSMAYSQTEQFAKLSVSQKTATVGQAFYVKITVYTPTWFTKAPNFGDYQVRNTFTLRTQRPIGGFETINGKRFTTLFYEYVVFPLNAGELKLPPLSVAFESPLEGDYKGKAFNVTTKGAAIEILPLPNNDNNYSLFVADNISISESWSNEFTDLKVGDVMERTIRIFAKGTLANMIPPIITDSLTWASIYFGKPILSQTVDGKYVSSERTEKHIFLLENEGSFEIPELQINYYHLKKRKWISKTIASKEINIADNPDLSVLRTLQDSLSMGEKPYSDAKSKPILIFGLSIKNFVVLITLVCAFLFGLYLLIKKLIRWYKDHKAHYLLSEKYHFKQLIGSIKSQDTILISNQLYKWLNKLNEKKPIITVNTLVNQIEDRELAEIVFKLHQQTYGSPLGQENTSISQGLLVSLEKQLKTARKKWSQQRESQQHYYSDIIK